MLWNTGPAEDLNLSIEEIAELRARTFSEVRRFISWSRSVASSHHLTLVQERDLHDENYSITSDEDSGSESGRFFGNGRKSISILKTPEGCLEQRGVLTSTPPSSTGRDRSSVPRAMQGAQRKLFATPPQKRTQVFLSPFSSLPQVFMSPQRQDEHEVVYTDRDNIIPSHRSMESHKSNRLPPRPSTPKRQQEEDGACKIRGTTDMFTPNKVPGGLSADDWEISPIGPSKDEHVHLDEHDDLSFTDEQNGYCERASNKSKRRIVDWCTNKAEEGQWKDISMSLDFTETGINVASSSCEPMTSCSTISPVTPSSSNDLSSPHSVDHDSTVLSVSVLPSIDALDISGPSTAQPRIAANKKKIHDEKPNSIKWNSREENETFGISRTSNPKGSPSWTNSLSTSISSDKSTPSKAYKVWKLRQEVDKVRSKYHDSFHGSLC